MEERENYRCSREIVKNFSGVHNGELYRRKMVDTRAGRLQGLRAPPQINISFQPRQPPTVAHPSSPRILPTPRSLPFVFCRFPRDLAYLRLAILHPVVFSLVSLPFSPLTPCHPRFRLIRSLHRPSLAFFASSPDDSVIAQSQIVLACEMSCVMITDRYDGVDPLKIAS